MVRLTRIYTRTGDGGDTRLADMSVARKTDPRVEAYGDVDETNSTLGVALALGQLPTEVTAVLRTIQNELFDLGADLSKPFRPSDPEQPELRITAESIDRLEGWCDEFSGTPAVTDLVHPAGRVGRRRPAARGPYGGPAGRAGRVGGRRGLRRRAGGGP